ncbi:hypothetical protein CLOM_g23999, partial [Closterium sp. NIES-68]
FDPGSG